MEFVGFGKGIRLKIARFTNPIINVCLNKLI